MTSLTVEFYFANSEFHCYVHAAIMCINGQGLRYLILNVFPTTERDYTPCTMDC